MTQDVAIPAKDGATIRVALALPPGAGPFPGVIVIHEAFGLNDDIRRIAARFAEAGYAAIAPDLYSRGPKVLCVARTMRALSRGEGDAFDDLDAARAWLGARDDVDASRIGVAGFCLGGGFALLYAVRAPVGATAPFYAVVPKDAEQLRGVPPVVASYGGRDRTLTAHPARLEGHLRSLGVTHEVKVYPDAGHSFMSRHSGLLASVMSFGPMHVGYRHEDAEDAWSRMLAFFGEHLGSSRHE